MYNQPTADFYHHLDRLKTPHRIRFLQGVYKQLAVSNKGRQANGEFRRGLENISSDESAWGHITSKEEFLLHVVHALNQHGLNNHAKRLIEQNNLSEKYEGFKGAYERFRYTLSELEKVDSEWKKKLSFFVNIYKEGVGIDVGGFNGDETKHKASEPFSASIVLHSDSYGKEKKRYEIFPIFDGKILEELFGKGHDSVVGDLKLEDALALAKATLEKDPDRFRQAYEMALINRDNP